uniref:Ogr/Delta-like zinc finger n=1 Tax=Candidatus Kentrum sp. FM TaxID=2126340 RepID=A0A450VLE0_9GAMM|nr:MAG: Ogr/Delta-like zinc finger [Candidatus Kentron sp. FM]VFJ43615.1 MAG: Ogr/Delta-like zinc finger [Candidatus Kentron sp. FM]VFK05636.1 MAG: Ogr/Delta-like zinc finger [Candidatus Kentron sp. FM]
MAHRVTCPHCKSAARITSSKDITRDIEGDFAKELYCVCTNPACNCRFVATSSFSHYLIPPKDMRDEDNREPIPDRPLTRPPSEVDPVEPQDPEKAIGQAVLKWIGANLLPQQQQQQPPQIAA